LYHLMFNQARVYVHPTVCIDVI